jgi:FG-GAP-like repeat
VLYHKNGDGTFTDATAQAGLKTSRDEWSTGCSFLDYDRDGKVDIFVVRYVDFSYDSVPILLRRAAAAPRLNSCFSCPAVNASLVPQG